MKHSFFLLSLLFACTLSAQKNPNSKYYGQNFIKNPGAEIPLAGEVSPHWGSKDTLSSDVYGHTSGEFDWDWGKSKGLDNNYFRFSAEQRTVSFKTREQNIDLSELKDSIRANRVVYFLSGFFGTFNSQDNGAVNLHAVFTDKNGKEIAHVHTDDVVPSDIKVNDWDMLKREKSGMIPAETAKVKIYMTATGIRAENGENLAWAAWADNLVFSLARPKG